VTGVDTSPPGVAIDVWRADSLRRIARVRHGFSGRAGGVSPRPFDSLNLSSSVGDDAARVDVNRARLAVAFGLDPDAVTIAGAVHGSAVATVEDRSGRIEGVDALLTTRRRRPLLVLGADCPVLFLHDSEAGPEGRGVVGLIHAGWRGIVAGVVEATIDVARDALRADATRLHVAISPSIGSCCFEVGEDVASRLEGVSSDGGVVLRSPDRVRPHADLAALIRAKLLALGVATTRIDGPGPCTRCHAERFFSHRAARGPTGRGGAMIALV